MLCYHLEDNPGLLECNLLSYFYIDLLYYYLLYMIFHILLLYCSITILYYHDNIESMFGRVRVEFFVESQSSLLLIRGHCWIIFWLHRRSFYNIRCCSIQLFENGQKLRQSKIGKWDSRVNSIETIIEQLRSFFSKKTINVYSVGRNTTEQVS